MQHLKTFRNGQRAEWQIEGEHPQPVMHIDGMRAGTICQCMNMDADGNSTKPQVVDGKTLVAYVRHAGTMYWLVDREFDAPKAARDAAIAAKRAAYSTAWHASDAGKAHADRRRKEREWDALYNEGGDGYNPYRDTTAEEAEGTAFDRRDRHYPEGA